MCLYTDGFLLIDWLKVMCCLNNNVTLIQGSQLSWKFKSVLKLSWNSKLSWNFTHLARVSWKWLLMQFSLLLTLSASCNRINCLHLKTTSHYYLDIVDVDCPVVLLTVFMTALFSSDLHEWISLKKKVCVYYVYLAACGRKMSLSCPEI